MTTILLVIIALAVLPAALPVLFILAMLALALLPFGVWVFSAMLVASGEVSGSEFWIAVVINLVSLIMSAGIIQSIRGK